ncbi:metalloregulator ArsR/SmtB family transcription factor [Elongatibacter sediminis]|uniref:Metalloregulator ArsR/SmtB family transcription factor n=1 Tax=Elongatibacter sediminis TaxID=3119006 RepID=A0AAW9RIQ5_9GAMM
MKPDPGPEMPGERLFKALGDPQRLRILRALRGGDLAAGELADRVAVSAATCSHHLGILRDAGLVRVRRDGQSRIYTLNLSVFEEAVMMLTQFLKPGVGRR